MEDEAEGQAFDPPFEVIAPEGACGPVVLSSPHSGAIYPPSFLAASRLDPQTLRRSEDAFVDELFLPAVAAGAPLLRAHFPRAYLDLNREPYELDPRMFAGRLPDYANTRSLRVAAGLGVIPRIVGEAQAIYTATIPVDSALQRIARLHAPYHARLTGLLDVARARFGQTVLIDCHSMPSSTPDVEGCDIVLGDRFGASAGRFVIDLVEQALAAEGLTIRRNRPYAGGYITERHGAPAAGRHALQVEINRKLYMDERSMRLLPEAAALGESLGRMVAALSAQLSGGAVQRLAAE